jgi:molybdate ABC transporter permease protein
MSLSPLWLSLRIAAIATLITSVLGIAAAYFMQRYRGRGRSLLDSLFLSPLVLPPTVLGFGLLLLLGNNGPIGRLLAPTGLSIVFTWYAAVLTATIVAFPLMYKTTLAAFEQIDPSLQGAARTLGASELTVLWRITLPLALPGLVAGITLSFARALGEFGATLMLAGNIPGRTQTLPMAIYFAVEGGDFRAAALWSALALMISLGAIALANQYSPRPSRRHKRKHKHLFPPSPAKKELERGAGGEGSATTGPTTTPHLEVNIRKQLPGFSLNVNFSTRDSQPLGLLGASGAGKSLVLRCIAGLETPDEGRIVLNGQVLFDSARGVNVVSCDRNVAILFQNYALFPHLTIAQNVAFGLSHSLQSAAQIAAIVTQQLAAVQLQDLSQRYPHELSGGQQQRVALARALATNPKILLLDEPFSALDTHLRSQIEQQLITRLQSYRGTTLLVTHNLEEAYRLCHELLVVDSGNIVAFGPKHEIFNKPKTLDIAKLTGCKNFSPATAHGVQQIRASHWQCLLKTLELLPKNLTHIGIRAHQITFLSPTHPPTVNTFRCWLAATSETPHRMTLFLKLHHPPTGKQDYHLQAEVFKEKWSALQEIPPPWKVFLDPQKLILLVNE